MINKTTRKRGKVFFGHKLRIVTVLLFICLMPAVLYAQDEEMLKLKPGQPIIVDGDKVEFFEKKSKIVAEGNVSIQYGDVFLKCDSIEVDTKNQKAACRGNVRIEHPDGVLTGDYIVYDLLNKRGEIMQGEVNAFPWFGQATETSRVGDNEYLLKKGAVSTCDLDSPHYRITAEQIRIFPDDKVIAKNAVVYIGKVPVMWFPYYYHPIINTRAKVQFIPGRSSDWGYFMLSAWRFYLKGNTRVDLLFDYRTKKGFAEGANLYYYMSDLGMAGLGEGIFRSYFIQQNGKGTYDPSSFRDEDDADPELRKRFQWMHRIDFDKNTVAMLEFNKLSDEYVIKDYYYDEYEENNWVPQNYLSVTTAQENFMLNLEVKKRFNDFYTVTQKLPEVEMDIPQQSLWDTPVFYQSETSFTAFEKEYKCDNQPGERVDRFDTFQQFSYAGKIGCMNVVPYGTFRETIYSKTKWDKSTVARATIGGGASVFTTFHRIFKCVSNWQGMEINDLRHILVPRVKYFHTHQPTVDKNNLYQMDDLDELEKENGIEISIENKLQTKRHYDGHLDQVDLVRFIVSTVYDFRLKKGRLDFEEKGGGFRDINFDLELRPYNWFYIDAEMDIEAKEASVKTGSVEFSIEPDDDFHLAFGYRYERRPGDPENQLTFDLGYRLNPKWKVGWYERFNLQRTEIEEQQFSVTRDLHCWEVEVAYDLEGSNFFKDDYTFWIAFKIKAFPDLQLGLSRSFTRRPAGATRR